MPIEQWLDAECHRVVVKVSGKVTLDEIVAAIDASVKDPRFTSGFDVYSDHLEVEEPISTEQARALTAHLQSLRPHVAGARWAVVTRARASYGMIRMISAYAQQVPMDVRPFETHAEAEAWLATPKP
jgi:hypothetical protein